MDVHTLVILALPIGGALGAVHAWVSWLNGDRRARTALADISLAVAATVTAFGLMEGAPAVLRIAGPVAIIGASSFKIWEVRRTREDAERIAEEARERLEPPRPPRIPPAPPPPDPPVDDHPV